MRYTVLSGDFKQGCGLGRALWPVGRLKWGHVCDKLNSERCFVVEKQIFYYQSLSSFPWVQAALSLCLPLHSVPPADTLISDRDHCSSELLWRLLGSPCLHGQHIDTPTPCFSCRCILPEADHCLPRKLSFFSVGYSRGLVFFLNPRSLSSVSTCPLKCYLTCCNKHSFLSGSPRSHGPPQIRMTHLQVMSSLLTWRSGLPSLFWSHLFSLPFHCFLPWPVGCSPTVLVFLI